MPREGFDKFAQPAIPRLLRTAYLLVGDHHLAEDLVQDVLSRVYVAWPKIHGEPYGYAYRALTRAVLNRHRWRLRHSESSWVPDVDDVRAGITTNPANAIGIRDEVLTALKALPPKQRAVIVFRYYLDLTEPQTADALDVSVGTVKSHHSRAIARLRELLGDDIAEPAANFVEPLEQVHATSPSPILSTEQSS